MYDQQQKVMLRSGRVSATISLLPLLKGEVIISSAQLFGAKINLYKNSASSPLNCQFVIDALRSKDTTSQKPLNISIGSLIIRNGSIVYNQLDKPYKNGVFSPHHINISKLSSHIILYKLSDDYLNASLKRLAFNEQSGISVRNFKSDITLSKERIGIKNLQLSMPRSSLSIPEATAKYRLEGDTIHPGSLTFNATVAKSYINPSDFAALLPPELTASIPTLNLSCDTRGTDKHAEASLSVLSRHSKDFLLNIKAEAEDLLSHPTLSPSQFEFETSEHLLQILTTQLDLPSVISRAGNVSCSGEIQTNSLDNIFVNTTLQASNIGDAYIHGNYDNGNISATLKSKEINLATITDDNKFGKFGFDLNIYAQTTPSHTFLSGKVEGIVSGFTYNNYSYQNANVNLSYNGNTVSGHFDINDPNVHLAIDGSGDIGKQKRLQATATLADFCPYALNLTHQFGKDRFSLRMDADFNGSTIDNAAGTIALSNLSIINPDTTATDAHLRNLTLSMGSGPENDRHLTLNSDFANLTLSGNITYSEITRSLTNLVAQHLPVLPGLPAVKANNNNFHINARVNDIHFLKRLTGIPVDISIPLTLYGFINSCDNTADITLSAPSLKIAGTSLSHTQLKLWTEDNAINTAATTLFKDSKGQVSLSFDCHGQDNTLHSVLSWDNMRNDIFRGKLNTITAFKTDISGTPDIAVSIPHSSFEVGDTIWYIHSRSINHKNGRLSIDHLAVENENQHLYIDGEASASPTDTITASLKDINVGYVLDLVNFHSVRFDGRASGRAMATGVFKELVADADLDVQNFRFERGRMGTLRINADYNNTDKRINIDAIADDPEADGATFINGYISPSPGYIDLDLGVENTRLEFMKSFCGSFLSDIDLHGSGRLRLYGPLSAINLVGKAAVNGGLTLTSTNCRYTLHSDTINFVTDDILFNDFTLKDKYGNTALLNGGIHHRNLGRIAFDLTATTHKLLAYDYPTLDDGSTFCGHAIIDGKVGIHGRGNEISITANCTPLQESFFTYNASSPESIKSQDFITWGSATPKIVRNELKPKREEPKTSSHLNAGNDRANIRMNFQINTTPDARLHLIMDETTGDYIDLFGSGALNVHYYNKGALDIYGNYNVDHGTYKMTIQTLLRRDFSFVKGGMISFGGDPYNAALNLQAAYTLNSVSLADLNIGSSFKANNVPVNCLMNISGTPEAPAVTFGLNLPTLSNDARQMVHSVINSEEEMNNQVLYLLAIGRFYSQNDDANNEQRTRQSTLAMQSFLSGTLSQQLNGILGQVIGNRNWSIGANITPGTDGFNNAVYEGLLSGRMFNNRLLFDGQFGYRDNINTNTQNFIGDFSLQYLLTPNGNISLKMYNQSNDRYFTRSSLNTQGIGVVIQKEFGK